MNYSDGNDDDDFFIRAPSPPRKKAKKKKKINSKNLLIDEKKNEKIIHVDNSLRGGIFNENPNDKVNANSNLNLNANLNTTINANLNANSNANSNANLKNNTLQINKIEKEITNKGVFSTPTFNVVNTLPNPFPPLNNNVQNINNEKYIQSIEISSDEEDVEEVIIENDIKIIENNKNDNDNKEKNEYKNDSENEVEVEKNDLFPELARKARELMNKKADNLPTEVPKINDRVILVIVKPYISNEESENRNNNIVPLTSLNTWTQFKIEINKPIGRIRHAWCSKFNFHKEFYVLTFNDFIVFDSGTFDDLNWEGKKDGAPLELVSMTRLEYSKLRDDIEMDQKNKIEKAIAEVKRHASQDLGSDDDLYNDSDSGNASKDNNSIRIVLQGKKGQVKVLTSLEKTVGEMITHYKNKMEIPPDTKIVANFEGDVLEPDATLNDSDVDDKCIIDLIIVT